MKSSSVIKIRLISGVVLLFALLLVTRLYVVQVVSGEEFVLQADRQYTRTVSNIYNRGSIYFEGADGALSYAATLKTGFTLAINPMVIKNPELIYARLSDVVQIEKEDFMRKATKEGDPYEELARRLDPDIAEKINALSLPGVHTFKEKWRFYPQNSLAAKTIGFVGYKGDELTGRYGLESYYDDVLSRKNDNVYVNFFAEIFSNIKKGVSSGSKKEGDIVLTLEPTVQAYLEDVLEGINKRYSSNATGGIIIDPHTGEIRAMGVIPSFNLNTFNTEKDPVIYANQLVENVYEMGSIIKPITIAAGLDSNTITARTTYYDRGYLILNNKTIYNHDKKERGTVSMQDVLSKSLNTGVAFIADKMGKTQFSKYMLSFAGEKTGIDLPNEAQPLVRNLESPRDIEHATASYGQGIAMSPVATVRALSALANGGMLITPRVVKAVNYNSGLPKLVEPMEGKRVIRPETSEEISRMLVEVVDTALLEGTVKMERYSIAAKTGTAQIARADGQGYYDDRYLHSFFGYFPAYDPEYLVFLFTVEPKGVTYASNTLTHPFIDVAKFLINYYKIPPDR